MRVLTIGTFDLLHRGHRRLFHRCREFGELTIGVNSDRFVVEYKGEPPHEHQIERLFKCGIYATSSLHDGRTDEFLERHNPDLLVVGSDWHVRDYLGQLGVTQEFLDDLDISVLYVPRTPGVSSTERRRERS